MSVYTKKIPPDLAVHYRDLLKEEDCVFLIPQHAFFCAKSKDWQCTFYKTGKVVVQGKDINYIVKKYFEDDYNDAKEEKKEGEIAPYPHIGTDESGKGDFFGPLVIAGCYLTENNAIIMKEKGAVDSKKLDDKKILMLSDIIKENSVYEIVVIENKKYNEIYLDIGNLNRLLAKGHAAVLENLVLKTGAKIGISDKFGDEKLILNELRKKNIGLNLIQQPRAEIDTAVACASILARAEFVKKISYLSYKYDMDFPKGAGENVLSAGNKFIRKYGKYELKNVSKLHFKTASELIY